MKNILIICLCLMLWGCGEKEIPDRTSIKEIKYANYISKDYSDIQYIHKGFVFKETENFYWILPDESYFHEKYHLSFLYKSYRDKQSAHLFTLNKNPKIRKRFKNIFGKETDGGVGLWDDGDRVKEGKFIK